MDHSKEWHLHRVTWQQKHVNLTAGTLNIRARGAFDEAVFQAI